MKKMDFWYQTPPGSLILELEKQIVSNLLNVLPGECLVQINGPSDLSLVESSAISRKYYFSLNGETTPKVPAVKVEVECLPLKPEIVDVMVLAHTLAFVKKPQVVLSEVCPAIAPGGALIIIGFNPWSLWNLLRFRYRRYFLWNKYYHTRGSVKCWLTKNNFQIGFDTTFCYRLPYVCEKKWRQRSFLDSVGRLCFPGMGGLYIVMAHKRTHGVTPLIDRLWMNKAIPIDNVVEPTTQVEGRL